MNAHWKKFDLGRVRCGFVGDHQREQIVNGSIDSGLKLNGGSNGGMRFHERSKEARSAGERRPST
ncbi:MAG: hypothetical protein IPK83_13840 [Planctomycetes bacterium]|nr:hypothetical protein [Planctomycetota bacterium]